MGVFNVAGAFNKKSSSQDYGFLVDRLSILESQLASDGNLAPGDYDLLKKEAQNLYSHPSLTPAQRSNIDVKMASYDSKKSAMKVNEAGDLGRINHDFQNNMTQAARRFANDPALMLEATAAIYATKLQDIKEAADNAELNGKDPAVYLNAWNETSIDYNDIRQATEDIAASDPTKGAPQTDYAAYLTTNSKGEVVDVKFGRVGSQGGYQFTKASYGGLPIYGKVNRKDEAGQNVFLLGNQKFVESQSITTDSGSGTPQKVLVAEGESNRGTSVNPTTMNFDATNLRVQNYVPAGGWAKTSNAYYKDNGDGSYDKFVNYKTEDLQQRYGLSEGDILPMPDTFSSSILNNVRNTNDGMATSSTTISLPANQLPQPSTATPATTTPSTSATPAGVGESRTPAPTVRAPQGTSGVAAQTAAPAKGFFQKLFNY